MGGGWRMVWGCGLAAVVVSGLAVDGSEAPRDGDRPLSVRDTTGEVEEVIVTASPPREGAVPTAEFMQQVYNARGVGACLYAKGRYEEAFPYLEAAARKGFKMAQARVGFLYQQGLGVERDSVAAMGWYGVAATGTTLPGIRNWFRDAWRGVPDEHRPAVAALVGEYREKYGTRRHRVNCDLGARAGTFLKTLTCRFQDDAFHVDHGRILYMLSREPRDENMDPVEGAFNPVEADGILDNPYPTSTPMRAGSYGC
ncbi:MAG: hypothetical protein OXI79_09300 [Gammaproteobacteria bacterium]|nr:hypothetical protein [Gammaproteobacteria bacterium]